MTNINCEICGGNKLVKQGDRFICSDCGTSYSLEDARKLLQNNSSNSGVHNNIKDATHDINYVGYCKTNLFGRKMIRVTNKGIELGGKVFSVSEITGFQFKSVCNEFGVYLNIWNPSSKLFTVPMGTLFKATFTINGEYGFEHSGDKKQLTFDREEYIGFVEAIWKLCSRTIVVNVLNKLRNGDGINIDDTAVLFDDGIEVKKLNVFKKDEVYFYNWEEARKHMALKHYDGNFRIEFDNLKFMGYDYAITLGFLLNDNITVLEFLLQNVISKKINRLSDLL